MISDIIQKSRRTDFIILTTFFFMAFHFSHQKTKSEIKCYFKSVSTLSTFFFLHFYSFFEFQTSLDSAFKHIEIFKST
jgi:hypothetical protein